MKTRTRYMSLEKGVNMFFIILRKNDLLHKKEEVIKEENMVKIDSLIFISFKLY